ncbi:hypothetical protein Ancab_038065, partial [Ancistrocladus abbreviatus]
SMRQIQANPVAQMSSNHQGEEEVKESKANGTQRGSREPANDLHRRRAQLPKANE